MFKQYSYDELKLMPNGFYLRRDDPNEETDFWQPNDEIIELKNGEIIDSLDIKTDISRIKVDLTLIENIQKLPPRTGGLRKYLKDGKIVDVIDIESELRIKWGQQKKQTQKVLWPERKLVIA